MDHSLFLIPHESIFYSDPLVSTQNYSRESDLWSIGLVIYFMSCGSPPSRDLKILSEYRNVGEVPFPPRFNEKGMEDIKNLVCFCVKKRKENELPKGKIFEKIRDEKIFQ